MKFKKRCGWLIPLIFLVGCVNPEVQQHMQNESPTPATTIEETTVEQDSSEIESTVVIRSIGDILIHDTVFYDAATEDGYNFDHMFAPVKPYLENADITTANLEVIAAGEDYGISTYPFFNSPEEIIPALQNVGVDIVSNATNHTMDLGGPGAYASIANLQKYGLEYVGSYESWEDYRRPRIIEKNGIKFGFLSYSYGTNGNPIPEGEEHLITLIDKDVIREEVQALNELVDVSIVVFQMGEEYEFLPVENQYHIAQVTRDAGASFILGGHPHIVQPFIRYNAHQGGWFSHGNFLSGQYEEHTRIGGIGEYCFHKLANGEVILGKIRFMPTYNIGMPETTEYYVVPLADANEYGFYNSDYWMEELRDRMSYFTDVEVVDYLD